MGGSGWVFFRVEVWGSGWGSFPFFFWGGVGEAFFGKGLFCLERDKFGVGDLGEWFGGVVCGRASRFGGQMFLVV